MMRFTDRRILVTGAGAGIGRAAAQGFADEGAHVLAVDRDPASLAGLSSAIGTIEAITLDVTDDRAIARLAGGQAAIDVLFNCAGYVANGDLLATSRGEWDRTMAINVTAPFVLTQEFLPGMIDRGGGVIVNMSSIASSKKGVPDRCAYGSSKAALIGMTKSIAADYVARGIRCNAVCPGTVDTPSLKTRLEATGDYEAALQRFIGRQPMGRLAQAGEIAALVLYLASDDAAFITGQAIAIDGGWSI